MKWGQFGPALFNLVIQTYDSKDYVKPPEVFCPVNWYEISPLIEDHKFSIDEHTLAIHLWNDVWRRKNLDKDAAYPLGCVYEQLKMKYRIS